MKRKITASISEKRILQLSNDLSEGIESGRIEEWRTVALYFREQYDRIFNDTNGLKTSVCAMLIGKQIVSHAVKELDNWIKRERRITALETKSHKNHKTK